MQSAVHALGPASIGSCPLALVARTQRPRVAKSVLAGSPGTQVGSVIRNVWGGLWVRGDVLKSGWSFRKGSPPEICKSPSGRQLRRACEHEWPQARRAVALLAVGSLARRLARLSARLPARLQSGIARAWVDRSRRIELCNRFYLDF